MRGLDARSQRQGDRGSGTSLYKGDVKRMAVGTGLPMKGVVGGGGEPRGGAWKGSR